MSNITIIGISGKKNSGKNTVAKIISDLLPDKKVREYSFAGPLKEEVAKACGVTVKYIDDHKDNFRLILQGWGTDFKRKLVIDSYWTDKMFVQLNDAIKDNVDVALITDVRFPNEFNFLNRIGGVMVRVSRPIISQDSHVSETALDSVTIWHHVILNSGTIEDLNTQVKELINKCNL